MIISDIPCEPQQQPLCDTECGDNDEANELGDQDGEGSATDEDSEPESDNAAGSTHEVVDDEGDEELSATVSAAQGMQEADTSSESNHMASGLCSIYQARTLLIFCILPSEANELVAVNQTHFTMEAIPSRRGRIRRTRNMAEMFVCICGSQVEEQERVLGSKTALRCGYDGCETSWVNITFLCILSMC